MANDGGGMILTNVVAGSVDPDLHFVPTVHVAHTDQTAIYSYVSSTPSPTARLLTGTVSGGVVAPDVASFSSRGPALAAGGDLIVPSDLNCPSIAIGALAGTQTVKRTVMNVDDKSATYTVAVSAPAG